MEILNLAGLNQIWNKKYSTILKVRTNVEV